MHLSLLRPIPFAFLLALAGSGDALAAACKPDALGTSRVIAVDPAEHGRIGSMQYGETLPLNDHEVVLTFDDGPLPPRTTKVLDILAAECVRATFFLVGKMASAFPSVVRRELDDGHTIATHSQTHSPRIWKWPIANQEADINAGIASVGNALGDPAALAPFFRFPGLGKSAEIEKDLAAQGIMIWSADFPADDWLRIGPKQVAARALQRLEHKGKGVLLLHDIHPVTVAALPILFAELKKRHYNVVHVVPAGPNQPKTVTDPRQWVLEMPAKPVVTAKPLVTAKPVIPAKPVVTPR
jgi:peptidoglycan/xylan/chitin deacetylase (PgdA/CDA1 family)